MTDPAFDPIARVRALLREYPPAQYETGATRVTVEPVDETGFTVAFVVERRGYTVHCDRWHERFSLFSDAVDLFAVALTEDARLAVWSRGGKPYAWILQQRVGRLWRTVGTVRRFLFRFWQRREVVYLCNRFLEAA